LEIRVFTRDGLHRYVGGTQGDKSPHRARHPGRGVWRGVLSCTCTGRKDPRISGLAGNPWPWLPRHLRYLGLMCRKHKDYNHYHRHTNPNANGDKQHWRKWMPKRSGSTPAARGRARHGSHMLRYTSLARLLPRLWLLERPALGANEEAHQREHSSWLGTSWFRLGREQR